MQAPEDGAVGGPDVDDEQLERISGGRVWAPTGVMRYGAILLVAVFAVIVMGGMLWLMIP